MIDVIALGVLFGGASMLVSVCFWNIRRSRCTKLDCVCCKQCVIERTLMSDEEMIHDKIPPNSVVDGIRRASLDTIHNNSTFV